MECKVVEEATAGTGLFRRACIRQRGRHRQPRNRAVATAGIQSSNRLKRSLDFCALRHYPAPSMNADVTRERLLCSALEIFANQGYEGASTRDVCAAAGIGNASIHYHFGDKAALYRELFVRLLDEFEQRMRGCGMDRLSGREALLAYYE